MIKRPYGVIDIADPADVNVRVKSVDGPQVNYFTCVKICGVEPTEDRLGELANLLNTIYGIGVQDARKDMREALGIGQSNFGDFIPKR